MAQRPTLLDDWEVVRAAQHMIEIHGGGAAEKAEQRSAAALELQYVKRWKAIADVIRMLNGIDPAA
ncbi:MAG TPA: hypothetical protein VLV50_08995 [Stellaceae bacterium]|nr:hypothetical protein [Stellaceae bacterium]